MLFVIYCAKKLWSEQNEPGSISFLARSCPMMAMSMTMMGWYSMVLPWRYIQPVRNNLSVLSVRHGIGKLVCRHSRW